MSIGEQYIKRVSAFSPLLVCHEHFEHRRSPHNGKGDIAFDDAPYIQYSLYPDVLPRHYDAGRQ